MLNANRSKGSFKIGEVNERKRKRVDRKGSTVKEEYPVEYLDIVESRKSLVAINLGH